jgi:hypothetical protein
VDGSIRTDDAPGASPGLGPKQRLVPLINGADAVLAWCVEDVLGLFDCDFSLPGAPLFPSERRGADSPGQRASGNMLRRALMLAVEQHLPS